DTQAAQGNATSNDPWQMVSVFDGDKSTNVVCEGFAKAFKYLCDLASISGVECRRVDGTLGGAGHMWNIVRMDDGRNYIADVTNCAGGTKVEDDPLFLAACTSGSVASGYTIQAWGLTYRYTYFDGTTNFYTEDELTLSKTPYSANTLTAKVRSESVSATYSKTKSVATKANVSVSNARGAITYANASTNTTAKRFVVNNTSGTVSIPKGTAVGTYTVVIKVTAAGNANYKSGSKTVSYKVTVGKATNGLKVKTSKKTVKYAKVSKKKQVVQPIKATGANGTVSYKKVSKGSSKYLSVNKKTGKVTVSKGTKKGTYTIKVQVSAAGNKNFKKATKTVTCKVVVS
ncbi:MAG: hypothetical protein Q4A07_11600, partial [Coriobacteriales bacterium]|nr:hypothetical protein [Coriobacteriales bacterium]